MAAWPIPIRAGLAQISAAAMTAGLLKIGLLAGPATSLLALASLEGLLAGGFSAMLKLPGWWLAIQIVFAPLLVLALGFGIPAWVWLLGFLLLWLIFRSNTEERVPLYLSNRATWNAVAALLPADGPCRFIDLGCGLGFGLGYLGRQRPDGEFHGVESAPIPFLLGWLGLRRRANCKIRFGNLWDQDLSRYQLVYAFLSPEPMPRLWEKARREMPAGALLLSNSFDIPCVKPDQVIEIAESGGNRRLLVWRIPG